MYPLLPKIWFLVSITLIIIVGIGVFSVFGDQFLWLKIAHSVAIGIIFFVTVFFGLSCYWAPWRCLLRRFPSLVRFAYPDINGVWVGCTKSNWPIIENMKNKSEDEKTSNNKENHPNLQEDPIAIEIKSHLFSVYIRAYAKNTDSESFTLTAKPRWDCSKGRIKLSYVYQQDTKKLVKTDQEQHIGAAEVVFDPDEPDEANGIYWTRRSWREGLNTAGKIELARRTQRHAPGKKLKDFVENLEGCPK